jgi:hypothetical protein
MYIHTYTYIHTTHMHTYIHACAIVIRLVWCPASRYLRIHIEKCLLPRILSSPENANINGQNRHVSPRKKWAKPKRPVWTGNNMETRIAAPQKCVLQIWIRSRSSKKSTTDGHRRLPEFLWRVSNVWWPLPRLGPNSRILPAMYVCIFVCMYVEYACVLSMYVCMYTYV